MNINVESWNLAHIQPLGRRWKFHLLTADDSCYEQNLNGIFFYTLKMMCANFQLSTGIFIFISCQQLLKAAYSWQQMLKINLNGIFIQPLKVVCMPHFSLIRWLEAELQSVTVNQHWTDARWKYCYSGLAHLVLEPELNNWGG